MDITEALAWLEDRLDHESTSVGVTAGDTTGLSLQAMRELMSVLGDPQDVVPVIHVTGTNGKGSVVAMISSLLSASGLSVGTYTSPHVFELTERIRRDGVPISRDALAEVLSAIAAIEPLLGTRPTWFEIMTAAAFRWFSEAPVDVAVVEVGLLGRYDATNVVQADVAVVTGVAGDHTDFKGNWRQRIAEEKAGIITPGRPVVLGDVGEDLVAVFIAEGAEPVLLAGRDFSTSGSALAVGGRVFSTHGPRSHHDALVLPLHGAHQVDNAALAVTAVEELFGRALDDDVLAEAFASVELPGRLEVVAHQPLVVLDGAHNPSALAAMAATLDDDFSVVGSRVVVLGMLAGRDPDQTAHAIAGVRADLVICTSVGGARNLDAQVLARACERAGLPVEAIADPAVAVQRALSIAAEEDMVVVCGSFRLLGQARLAVQSSM